MLSIIGTLIGLIGSFIPEVLKYLKVKEDHKHELAVLQIQAEMAKAEHLYRLEEIEAKADIASEKAIYSAAELKYTGVRWVDGLLAVYSGTVRPTITYLFMGLYMFVKYSQLRTLASETTQSLIDIIWRLWNSEDMAAFMTIIGFWFGGRLLKHTMATFNVGAITPEPLRTSPSVQLSPKINKRKEGSQDDNKTSDTGWY